MDVRVVEFRLWGWVLLTLIALARLTRSPFVAGVRLTPVNDARGYCRARPRLFRSKSSVPPTQHSRNDSRR